MPKPEQKPDKPPKDDTVIDASPSKPIDKDKDKEKKDKQKEKIRNAKKLEDVSVSASGSVTAGSWVAEMDTGTIRKNRLRGS